MRDIFHAAVVQTRPEDVEHCALLCLSKRKNDRYANEYKSFEAILSCSCARSWTNTTERLDAHANDSRRNSNNPALPNT